MLVILAELMRRIVDLKMMRETIIGSSLDPDVLVAALCWVDMEIAEHERFLEDSLKEAA
jgi:hypothetical protein